MSDIVSAEAAAQEGEALLPSAELAKNLGLTLAASVVLTFSTIVYMQGSCRRIRDRSRRARHPRVRYQYP